MLRSIQQRARAWWLGCYVMYIRIGYFVDMKVEKGSLRKKSTNAGDLGFNLIC